MGHYASEMGYHYEPPPSDEYSEMFTERQMCGTFTSYRSCKVCGAMVYDGTAKYLNIHQMYHERQK